MCKEALVLESGVPVTFSLHPNDCHEATSEAEEEIPMQQAENVHPGYLTNKEGKKASLQPPFALSCLILHQNPRI